MKIGIDFDNTIVSYDSLFYEVARDQNLIPADVHPRKAAVREYLIAADREDQWTLMQGLVYGDRMGEASLYDGVVTFLARAKELGHECAIISHKTRHPYMGPEYDLHLAAKDWINHNLIIEGNLAVKPSNIFFELTQQEKLDRIQSFGCDLFIDDLMEILFSAGFPDGVGRVLFAPGNRNFTDEPQGLQLQAGSWHEIITYLDKQ